MSNCVILGPVPTQRTFACFQSGTMCVNKRSIASQYSLCASPSPGCPSEHGGWAHELSCGRVLDFRPPGQHHAGHEFAHSVPGVFPAEPVLHAAHGWPPSSTTQALHRDNGAPASRLPALPPHRPCLSLLPAPSVCVFVCVELSTLF